jgi:transposase InsO family protein
LDEHFHSLPQAAVTILEDFPQEPRRLASMDFFVVPTATFGLLYAFVILRHDRRRIVHCNVTSHPTQVWVARQLREAFPFDTAPRCLIRDRDSIYGDEVRHCLKNVGIKEVVIAPRSPWQSPYVERVIGTVRRELLDHVIGLGERHLRWLLHKFVDSYYQPERCHQGLRGDSPDRRVVQPHELGPVISTSVVGGLHHRYRRVA